jgi:hypothetical protein
VSALIRRMAYAAISLAVASLVRRYTQSGSARRKHPLETWENEGGAVNAAPSRGLARRH